VASRERTDHLDELVTESRLAGGANYDDLSIHELVGLVNREDATVPAAVARVAAELADAIESIVARLHAGGRLIYVGAGTSGRRAQLDAVECESTFGTAPGQVAAIAAESDELEDDSDAGAAAIAAEGVTAADVVVAVSASGRTPYVVGALEAAADAGALTAAVVSAEGSELGRLAEHELVVVVGPEVVAGSTRLKAGTAQKLVLNAISTISMIRLGKTYGDLMVDVAGTNEKLRARARRAVRLATGASEGDVDAALADADGNAKVAIVSLLANVGAATAGRRLEASGGSVSEALR
jgi:N-acetylmuramic acid 6-phosphate etherase